MLAHLLPVAQIQSYKATMHFLSWLPVPPCYLAEYREPAEIMQAHRPCETWPRCLQQGVDNFGSVLETCRAGGEFTLPAPDTSPVP